MTEDEFAEAVRHSVAGRSVPPPATREAIAETEAACGYPLPPLLVRLSPRLPTAASDRPMPQLAQHRHISGHDRSRYRCPRRPGVEPTPLVSPIDRLGLRDDDPDRLPRAVRTAVGLVRGAELFPLNQNIEPGCAPSITVSATLDRDITPARRSPSASPASPSPGTLEQRQPHRRTERDTRRARHSRTPCS